MKILQNFFCTMNCHKRFISVFDSVVTFSETQKVGIYAVNKSAIAYISDLFHKFN